MDVSFDVSVIIPVFKAEEYIERAARSLFSQTLKNTEFVFVDDASPDNSMNILEKVLSEFPERKNQVVIIRHSKNTGVGQSRQDGINAARGKYLIHFDPDDWAQPDWLESLYTVAEKEGAQIVCCNYFENSDIEEKEISVVLPNSKKDLFHAIAHENFHAALWNKLIISSVAKNFKIQKGVNLWEDLSVVAPMMMTADRIVVVKRPLYHYNVANQTSVSHRNFASNAMSCIRAVDALYDNLSGEKLLGGIEPMDILRIQWSAKKGFLFCPSSENLMRWRKAFPDVNKNLLKLALPSRMLLISYFAKFNALALLKLYQKLKG